MAEPYHGSRGSSAIFLLTLAPMLALMAAAAAQTSCREKAADGRPEKTPPVTIAQASEREDAAPTAEPAAKRCLAAKDGTTIELAEASAATVVPNVGLIVAADSRHGGAYEIHDPISGEILERGVLPVAGDHGDDIEGLSVDSDGETIVAITSSGTIYEFVRGAKRFEAKASPYLVEPSPPRCSPKKANCGSNWEGLCLGTIAEPTLRDCDGVAVSKTAGTLVCVRRDKRGHLKLDRDRSVVLSRAKTLSGCDIDRRGNIWAATNLFGGNAVYEVGSGKQRRHQLLIAGSIEGIALIEESDSDTIELALFSDTNRAPSGAFRYRCGDAL